MIVRLHPWRGLVHSRITAHDSFSLSRRRLYSTLPPLPSPPALERLASEKNHAEASTWVTQFASPSVKIPKENVQLSFSRSSGPGGQNVNKVNTKATVRCLLCSSWIPRWALPALMKGPHYVPSTHSILISSTVHRSQSQNVEECMQKLHTVIKEAASGVIKKAPSAEQKKRVEGLAKAENLRRKADKMRRSSIKQGRTGRGFDF